MAIQLGLALILATTSGTFLFYASGHAGRAQHRPRHAPEHEQQVPEHEQQNPDETADVGRMGVVFVVGDTGLEPMTSQLGAQEGLDPLEFFFVRSELHVEVVARLKVHPESIGGAEGSCQSKRGVRADAPFAVNNFVDPPWGHRNCLSKAVLADAQRVEELFEQHFSGVDGFVCGGHCVSSRLQRVGCSRSVLVVQW